MIEKEEDIPLVVVPRKKISKLFTKNLLNSFSEIDIPPKLILLYDHKPDFKGLKLPEGSFYGLINEFVNEISKEYVWFKNLVGYGFFRLMQFLCAPNKVILRDDDTEELGSDLIAFQMKYLGCISQEVLAANKNKKIWNAENEENLRLGHIIGIYRGRNILQFSDRPSPIELLKFDRIWHNPNKSDELYRNYAKYGKTDEIDGNRLFLGTFFYSNHGCSSQISDYYSTIPPLDGWIRGNDDTNASRILFYLKRKIKLTSAMINYGVNHPFVKGITQLQTNRNLAIHINTIFFEPLARWIFNEVKSLNKSSLSAGVIIKKIGNLIVNKEYDDLKETYQNHIKSSKKDIVNVILKLKENQPEIYSALHIIDWDKCTQNSWRYFHNTGLLFQHWKSIFNNYNKIVPSLLKEIR